MIVPNFIILKRGLLLLIGGAALSACSSFSLRSQLPKQDYLRAISDKNCDQLQTWIKKGRHPHDLLQLKYTQVCDLNYKFQLRNPQWFAPLLLDIEEARALQTQSIDDDAKVWIQRARQSKVKKEKESFYNQVISSSAEEPLRKEAQEALFKLSPRLAPLSEQKDLLIVAADHRAALENKRALDLLTKLSQESSADQDLQLKILEQKRLTLKALQDKKGHLQVVEKIFDIAHRRFNKDRKQYAPEYLKAVLLWGRALWTENQVARARNVFTKGVEELKDLVSRQELLWVLGKLDDEQKDYASALTHFDQALLESGNGFLTRTLWSAGWLHYKQGDFAKAREIFLQLAATEESEKNRALYWATRSAPPSIDRDAEFKNLAQQDPLGYYGQLARYHLGESLFPLDSQNTHPSPRALRPYLGSNSSEEIEGTLFLAPNEVKTLVLDSVSAKVPSSDLEAQYALAKLYAFSGLYLPLFSQIQKLPVNQRAQLLEQHPELLFPTDYLDVIQREANKKKIPPQYVLSIIRQESSFDTYAKSPVDALGLMQMMPKVAAKKASQLGITYTNPHDLFNPEVNIPLGVDELSTLLKKYDNRFVLATAGYNAAATAITGWMQQRYRPDITEFIEEIGYDETRTYIKLVFRNYVIYSRLLAKEPIPFPSEFLQWK